MNRILAVMVLIVLLSSGCGYSKECSTSPLQEYNDHNK